MPYQPQRQPRSGYILLGNGVHIKLATLGSRVGGVLISLTFRIMVFIPSFILIGGYTIFNDSLSGRALAESFVAGGWLGLGTWMTRTIYIRTRNLSLGAFLKFLRFVLNLFVALAPLHLFYQHGVLGANVSAFAAILLFLLIIAMDSDRLETGLFRRVPYLMAYVNLHLSWILPAVTFIVFVSYRISDLTVLSGHLPLIPDWNDGSRIAVTVLAALIAVTGPLLMWSASAVSKDGQNFGSRLVGTRVLDIDTGEPPSRRVCFKRSLMLIYHVVIHFRSISYDIPKHSKRQGAHDIYFGTVVVESDSVVRRLFGRTE